MISFLRPIGIHRDINELEYISALLQSNQNVLRTSGTVIAADVAIYLKSRHGVIVSEEVIERLILTELAGQTQDEPINEILPMEQTKTKKEKKTKGKSADESEQDVHFAMDICQITAVLLIPELIEAFESKDMKIFAPFCDVITSYMSDGMLTGPILRDIFASVNEYVVSDEVITEMLTLANRPEGLIQALVNDVLLYKDNDDVAEATKLVEEISDPDRNHLLITSIYTASCIDTSADTFRRPSYSMQLWTTGIAAYFAYVLKDGGQWITTTCDPDKTSCNVASGLASWFSIFLQIVALGLPYIFLGSLSNANYPKLYRFPALLIGMVTVFLVTVTAYRYSIKTEAFDTSGNKDKYGIDACKGNAECIEACTQNQEECRVEYIVADDFSGSSYYLALILGCTILLSQVVDLILQLTPRHWWDGDGFVQRLVLPGTTRQERAGRQAAKLRMKQFLTNAIGLFDNKLLKKLPSSDNLRNHPSKALERFVLMPINTERVGGILWAWKRIWDGSLFSQEGVWLNSRLLACNFSQVMIFGLLIFFARVFFYKQNDFFYPEEDFETQAFIATQRQILLIRNFTDGYFTSFFNCTQENLDVDTVQLNSGVDFTNPVVIVPYFKRIFGSYEVARETLKDCFEAFPSVAMYIDASFEVLSYRQDNLKNLLVDFAFTPSQYIAAVWCGLIGGCTAVVYIAVNLIPSFVSTVMKYRSGVKPTLTSPEFLPYRKSMDMTTVLLGSAFWGCFFTATGAFIFVILLFVFVGLWPVIIGAMSGFLLIMVIKLSVIITLRYAFFKAFFRQKPGAANLMFVVLEVWNIALTLGFAFIRAATFMGVSILYIARIDTLYFAPGVGRFGATELDSVAITFEKDLLIHEAHRHMLIERLGLIYLIKLHSNERFASRAGSAWRLLFVLISMPWLQKYRISRNAVDLDEMIAHLEKDMEEKSEIFDRKPQALKISELKAKQAVAIAEKGTSTEISLRKRIAYLEQKNRIYEQHLNSDLIEKVNEIDSTEMFMDEVTTRDLALALLPEVIEKAENSTSCFTDKELLQGKESSYYEV